MIELTSVKSTLEIIEKIVSIITGARKSNKEDFDPYLERSIRNFKR